VTGLNLNQRPYVSRIGHGNFHVVGVSSVSPVFKTRDDAEAWLNEQFGKMPDAKRPKQRTCMRCQKTFLSLGFHNRLCDCCRGASDALGDEVRPALPKARGR